MTAPGLEPAFLYDVAKLARALGVPRSTAEAIMRKVPKQTIPGLRKSYARGSDVQAFLDANVAA